jgi:hypothetical protein
MNIVDSLQLKDLEQVAKANKYKLVKLVDSQGRQVVYQNQPTATAFKQKLTEIKERAQVLPNDSVYYIVFKNAIAGEEWAYRYIKGNPVTILQQQQPTLAQAAPAVDYSALSNKDQEIAALKNQIEQLKLQFMYEAKLNEMNAKLEALSEKKEEKNVFLGFAETVIPTLLPAFQEWINLRKFEAQAKMSAAGVKPPAEKKPNLPQIGSAQYESMLDKLSELSEDDFNKQIAQLASIDQDYAAQVYVALTAEDTNTENTTNENE